LAKTAIQGDSTMKYALILCAAVYAFAAVAANAADKAATLHAMAAKLETAAKAGREPFTAAMGLYWSDTPISSHHEPLLPGEKIDGPGQGREAMLKGGADLAKRFFAVMPDFHFENVYVRVFGDVIFVFVDQVGTLKDGTKFSSPMGYRFTVDDNGKFAGVILGIDPPSLAPILNAVRGAGPGATNAATGH
jgi:hypothetical protein